jgi:pilus assembly protein Flp/PilA
MLTKLYFTIKTWMNQEEGQDLVEYALIISLIALACIAGVKTLGANMATIFTNIGASIL